MKKLSSLTGFIFLFFSFHLMAQNPIPGAQKRYNQFNQLIQTGSEKINFEKEELEVYNNSTVAGFQGNGINDLLPVNNACDIIWQDAIFGTCMGSRNNLIPYDFENDGTIELITNASVSGFGTKGFWYILKYNPLTSGYDKVYVSDVFESKITKMTLADINGSGTPELIFGFENYVHIIDLTDLSTITTFQLNDISTWNGIYQIKFGDADNDSQDEIIISGADELLIINPSTFEIEHSFNLEGGDFDIGNVDADAELEIAFTHGAVIQINNGSLTEEYDFRPDEDNANGFIELSDTDGDGYMEAIVANAWYALVIYDVDIESPKFEVESDLDIAAFMMQDINNDGIEEIIYGDGQWGNIYCHNSQTGAMMWTIDNPEHGTTGIAIADFDNDQTPEVVWGAGCSSSGSDYLFIHNMNNQNFEWQSIHIDGPYYAIEIADVDEDGQMEIITVSYESESGYDSGILTIYDAVTKDIEFQSDGNFFYLAWTGIFNLEIADYENDGDLDIIIATGETYDGKIYVVDGNNYTIEAEHEYDFQDNISEFYALATEDIDNDGTLEFIAASEDKMYVINSSTFEVEWNSVTFSGFSIPKGILTGNVDGDSGKEIVLCRDYIYVYDDGTYTQSQSSSADYTAIKLYDWDNDGDLEIIAGLETGFVEILEGSTLASIATFSVSSEPIGGIEIADLNGDGQVEIIASSDGQIYFIQNDGSLIASQVLGTNVGEYDAIVAKDYDNDGKVNVLVGTNYSITEINTACIECLLFGFSLDKVDPTCGEDNGVLLTMSNDTTTLYSWQNFNFEDSLISLSAGLYNITGTNAAGCVSELSINLEQQELNAVVNNVDKSCFGPNDGIAYANIWEGTAPFVYNWSTGANTDTVSSLPAGDYTLLLTDANNCTLTAQVQIEQSELLTTVSVDKPACANTATGAASISIVEGAGPYDYIWDTTNGSNNNNNLTAGTHNVSVTDSNGCISMHTFNVDSTVLFINTNQLSASCNGENDGSANVQVSEGTSPYQYSWSNGTTGTNIINSVTSGSYLVTVVDANQCVAVDSVIVNESVLTLESDVADLDCYGDEDGSAVVFVTEGVGPFSYQWSDGSLGNAISGLTAGNYFVLVMDSIGCTVIEQLEVTAPPQIEINLIITNDDPETSELEGSIEAIVTGGMPPYFYNWDNGGTTSTIENLEEGLYNLLITDLNECHSDTSAQVETLTTVLPLEHGILKVYPNPTSDYLILENENELVNIQAFRLLSALGEAVPLQIESNQDNYTLTLNKLAAGTYTLLLKIDDLYFYKKIVVMK